MSVHTYMYVRKSPLFKSRKTKQQKTMATGVTMGLAEWIIDDTCLLCKLHLTYFLLVSFLPDMAILCRNIYLLLFTYTLVRFVYTTRIGFESEINCNCSTRPSTNQSTSLKSGSLFLVLVSVRTYIRPSVRTYLWNLRTKQKTNRSKS